MKKRKNFFTATMLGLIIGSVIVVAMNSCNKPNHTQPILPGHEFLTTPILLITDPSTHITDTLIWSEVPPATSPDTLRSFATLKQNYTYNIQILILDSTKCDTCDGFVVSNEIIARANYHLFCFYDANNTDNNNYGGGGIAPSSYVNVTIDNPNYDTNNPPLPFGQTDQLHTHGPSHGQLEVVLRHQPAVKNGDCAPGATDFGSYYNITVQ